MQATNAIGSWSAILLLLASTVGAFAEPVSINRGEGLGIVFGQGGNCYVILPEHLLQRRRTLSLRTATPPAFGEARIFKSFQPGADLSIGVVTGGATERCRQAWDDFPARTDALLDSRADATLVRVASSGIEERLPMRIQGRTFESLTAELAPEASDARIYKGTSGGILMIGNTVVGMATNALNDRQAMFLRIDEIKSLLDRLIEARWDRPQASHEEGRETDTAAGSGEAPDLCRRDDAVPLRSIGCNAEPLDPKNGCNNLATAKGPAILPPGSAVDIVAELDVSGAQPVDKILVGKSESDETTTAPKSVLVEIDSSTGGAPRWRSFGGKDMTPFGNVEIANGSRPFASRVKVRILSSWDKSKPTRVDCLAVVSARSGLTR